MGRGTLILAAIERLAVVIAAVHCFLPNGSDRRGCCCLSDAFTFPPRPACHSPLRTTRGEPVQPSSRRGSAPPGGCGAVFLSAQRQRQGGGEDGAVATAADEASDALASVGWAPPTSGFEGELTSDDPFVQQIDASVRRDVGVPLDELLNPAKVVNLERDLYNLRMELAELTGAAAGLELEEGEEASSWSSDLSTDRCDGGGGGEEAEAVRKSIEKKERSLLTERRAVFRGWLKNVFLGQAVLSLGLSWIMVTDPGVLFGGFDWFDGLKLDMPIRVLGFWWWWLFIVPSLRSRRPGGAEKRALDLAFVATPAVSLLAPVVTKDTAEIWLANLAVVMGCYAFAYLVPSDGEGDGGGGDGDDGRPAWLKFVYKSLDFGTGQERGARK